MIITSESSRIVFRRWFYIFEEVIVQLAVTEILCLLRKQEIGGCIQWVFISVINPTLDPNKQGRSNHLHHSNLYEAIPSRGRDRYHGNYNTSRRNYDPSVKRVEEHPPRFSGHGGYRSFRSTSGSFHRGGSVSNRGRGQLHSQPSSNINYVKPHKSSRLDKSPSRMSETGHSAKDLRSDTHTKMPFDSETKNLTKSKGPSSEKTLTKPESFKSTR